MSDVIIMHFEGMPLTAQVVVDGKRRLAFAWQVHTRDKNKRSAVMNYSASMEKATGKIDVRANPHPYDNYFTRTGHCTASAAKPGKAKK